MKTARFGGTSLIVLAVLLLPCRVDAQRTNAAARGTVQDQTGGSLPGATITARHLETGVVRTAVVNEAGRYLFAQLPVGAYEFVAELQGFQTTIRRGIDLQVGQDATINFSLGIGELTESVVVMREVPVVEHKDVSVSMVVDSRQLREMPLSGRDFVQLATLAPGVLSIRDTNEDVTKGTGIRPTFAGARPHQTGYLLDGTNIGTNSNFGTPGSAAGVTLGVETVREFQVLVNSFSAEFGNAAGGVINAISRSGSNQFSGSVFEFHRNRKFDAANFFDVADEEQPAFVRNQFGFTAGGPARRNKLFWFAAYEGLRQDQSQTRIARVPTAEARLGHLPSGTVPVNPAVVPYLDLWPLPNGRDFGDGTAEFVHTPPVPTEEDFLMVRGDWNIGPNASLFVRYSHDDASTLQHHTPVANIGTDLISRYRFLTVEETHIFSPNTTNMLRFSVNQTEMDQQDHFFRAIPQSLYFIPGAPTFGSFVFGAQFAQTIDNPGTAGRNPRLDAQDLFQLQNTFSWIRGAHAIKFGGQLNRYHLTNIGYPGDSGGQYQFSSFPDLLAGRPANLRTTAPGATVRKDFRQWLYGFFVQDEWQAASRLTLSLGLRYEAITVPYEINGHMSAIPGDYRTATEVVPGAPFFENPSHWNFAPRVGLAWDVRGDGRTALRAGFGFYHDQLVSNYLNQVGTSNPPFAERVDVRNPVFPDALAALEQERRDQGFATLHIFDSPNTRQPTMMQYNVSLQRGLTENLSATLAYVGSRGRNLQLNVLSNPPTPIVRPDGQLFFPAGAPRLNPNFANIFLRSQTGESFYNSVQMRVDRRFSGGAQLQAAYTWSKAIDDSSVAHGATDYGLIQNLNNPFDHQFDRGLANFHTSHNFVANGAWELPFGRNRSGAGRALLAGWQLGMIFQMSSGSPFFPIVGFDVNRILPSNNQGRPNLAAGASNNPVNPGNPDQYFDPSAFTLPELGTFGNLGRNTLIGPGLINADAVLSKNQAFGRFRAQFRLEVFNLFNRVNFANPSQRVVFDGAGPVAGAGRITRTATPARQMQFGVKLSF